MAEPFLSEIRIMSFNFAPQGWALCNGQLLPINQNQALFSLLGTTYGGNGQTTFALPDLRGRFPNSVGQGPGLSDYVLGQVAGVESTTLLSVNLPAHNHTMAVGTNSTTKNPTNNYLGLSSGGALYTPTPTTTLNPAAVGAAGGNQPFSIMPPYLTLEFCIALQGIFPSPT